MKAMVFAAGIGSRLRPFTDYHPKALAMVGGVTALERVIIRMKNAGINDIVINVHHFASQILEFLERNSYFGLNITISDETDRLLDTGGGLLKAEPFLSDSEPILLHNTDIVTDISIPDMEIFHMSSNADTTLLVSPRISSRMLFFSEDNSLRGWKNLKSGQQMPKSLNLDHFTPLAFGGVHIVSPSIFPYLRKYGKEIAGVGNPFSIMPFYLSVMRKLKICGWHPVSPFRWFDIGSPDKLAAADIAYAEK